MKYPILIAVMTASLMLRFEHAILAESPALLDQLTRTGIVLTDEVSIKLETPLVSEQVDGVARQRVLEEIAGGAGWKRFSRDSVVAPIEIDMNYVKNSKEERIGHLVYVAFVAHCDLDSLRDRDRMDKLFGSTTENAKAEAYHADEIRTDELESLQTGNDDRKYVSIRMPLLERVLIRGVIASRFQETESDFTISWILDPRFTSPNASPFSNEWSRLNNDDTTSHPYRGAGGYIHATKLSEPTDACLIETRMVIYEPTQWFSGSNLLRSKLPLLIQESVRKFRRQLGENESLR